MTLWLAGAQTSPTTPTPAAPKASGTNDPHAAAVELLRKVIQEQQRNPDKIIRTPSGGSTPTGRDSTKSSAKTPPVSRLSRAEMERQFLEGKITAKQFQRYLEDLEKNPPPPAQASGKGQSKGAAGGTAASGKVGTTGTTGTNAPGGIASSPDEAPEHKALSDVEAKIDEILAKRQAQIQAAKTNTATNAVPAGPMTRRQKLDALLRDLIQGKLTEQEYNAQREKVLAQPD